MLHTIAIFITLLKLSDTLKHFFVAFALFVFLFTACQKEINPISFIATSVGTLGTTSDSCTGAIVSGTYKKGTALVANINTVSVSVNVTTIGTYAIYTDTIKGIYFGKIDSFSTTGNQTVVLKGAGTPTDTGLIKFTIKYGTSTCKFFVRVDTGSTVVVTPPVNSDYFPMTAGSYWVYQDVYYDTTGKMLGQGKDSAIVTSKFLNLNGNVYNVYKDYDLANSADTGSVSYYRKNSNQYYKLDLNYGRSLPNVNSQEQIILNDNVMVGTTWTYQSVFVSNLGHTDTTIRTYKILGKSVAATVNGNIFSDVIKISQLDSFPATYKLVGNNIIETWFAKGVGPIYGSSKTSKPRTTFNSSEIKILRYKIF